MNINTGVILRKKKNEVSRVLLEMQLKNIVSMKKMNGKQCLEIIEECKSKGLSFDEFMIQLRLKEIEEKMQ
jgi:uncharacterized membrane protein YcaP (DUF421 family)